MVNPIMGGIATIFGLVIVITGIILVTGETTKINADTIDDLNTSGYSSEAGTLGEIQGNSLAKTQTTTNVAWVAVIIGILLSVFGAFIFGKQM